MFCPRCSQQQATDSMRFCSRCGFPLEGTALLLAYGGMVPQFQPLEGEQKISPRRRGVKQGALIFLLGAVIVPAMGVLYGWTDINVFGFLTAISAVLLFIGGLLRVLYAALFEEGAPSRSFAPPVSYAPPAITSSTPRMSALPPATANPTVGWRTRPQTAEIVQPPSVTDNTTRLLDRSEPDTE